MSGILDILGVGWPIRPENWPQGPEATFLHALIPFLVLVALGVVYILVVRRADERTWEHEAGLEEPEVRKAA